MSNSLKSTKRSMISDNDDDDHDGNHDSSTNKMKRKVKEPAPTTKTPYQEYFAKKTDYHNDRPHLLGGGMLIRGIKSDDDESDEESSEPDNSKYTKEEMDSVRFVLITQSRSDNLDQMHDFILGDQANSSMMMFNTSFSYHIRDCFFELKEDLSNMRKWDRKFDKLFAFTFLVNRYDVWMHDNEGDMDDVVLGLANLWKSFIKRSDDDLGIDAEYTRPGVMAFLEDFKESIEGHDAEPPFCFNFGL